MTYSTPAPPAAARPIGRRILLVIAGFLAGAFSAWVIPFVSFNWVWKAIPTLVAPIPGALAAGFSIFKIAKKAKPSLGFWIAALVGSALFAFIMFVGVATNRTLDSIYGQ